MNSTLSLLSGHLAELRKRLLISFLVIIISSGVAYIFSEQLIRILMVPILAAAQPTLVKLIYTSLTEAFITYLKVSLLAGLICSFPVLLYELWMFVVPGLYGREKKIALRIVGGATVLFAAGGAFAYFVVLPDLLTFFWRFSTDQLEAMPKLSSYLTFVARTTLCFGLAFEIPFLMVAARKIGVVVGGYFPKKRKYYYLVIIVLSFLLTTGDLFAAMLLALPLFGLYEIGIIIIRLFSSD